MGQSKQGVTNPWQKQVLRVVKVQANTIEVLPEGVLTEKGFSPVPVARLVGSPAGSELTVFDGNGRSRVSLDGSLGLLQMGNLESDNAGLETWRVFVNVPREEIQRAQPAQSRQEEQLGCSRRRSAALLQQLRAPRRHDRCERMWC